MKIPWIGKSNNDDPFHGPEIKWDQDWLEFSLNGGHAYYTVSHRSYGKEGFCAQFWHGNQGFTIEEGMKTQNDAENKCMMHLLHMAWSIAMAIRDCEFDPNLHPKPDTLLSMLEGRYEVPKDCNP